MTLTESPMNERRSPFGGSRYADEGVRHTCDKGINAGSSKDFSFDCFCFELWK